MSIVLYSGTPGSYKSYNATREIISWLGRQKNVIANFPVNARKYYKNPKKRIGNFVFKTNQELTPQFLLDFASENHKKNVLKAQTLVVIDEASIMFNPRQFGKAEQKKRMDWINFLANHRHYNYEFILIAQNDRMLDRQIRGLLEYDLKHRALKNWNFAYMLLSLLFKGLFHCVEYWYPVRIKTNVQLRKFNIKIANCYDTMALFKFKEDENKDKKEKLIENQNKELLEQQARIVKFLKSTQKEVKSDVSHENTVADETHSQSKTAV